MIAIPQLNFEISYLDESRNSTKYLRQSSRFSIMKKSIKKTAKKTVSKTAKKATTKKKIYPVGFSYMQCSKCGAKFVPGTHVCNK